MDAFAKSMDKYFIPVKLGSDSIRSKKGGTDTLMQETTNVNEVIIFLTVFLILALIDIGITNVVSNAFIAKSDKEHTAIATRGIENHGAKGAFAFSALEIICLVFIFFMYFIDIKNFPILNWKTDFSGGNPVAASLITTIFVLCSWILALNLMTNIILLAQVENNKDNLNVNAAGILNFFRYMFLILGAVLVYFASNEDNKIPGIVLSILIFIDLIIAIVAMAVADHTASLVILIITAIAGFFYAVYMLFTEMKKKKNIENNTNV